MPAAPIIIGAAAASGAAAAIGTFIVGSTVSAAVATAVGVGVLSGASTAIQGGKASDVLRSAVLGGAGSYVGGAIASKVTSSVAAQTGASLVDLEPSLRALSGEGASLAGAAAITAGNVAGAAATAAITGRPISEAALYGAALSIPTALSVSSDFNKLHPVVQSVVSSAAQAAIMGQDVSDAAIESLVISSNIVSRAIGEVPGGQDFIKNHPTYSKYVVDSVSAALAAQLQGKDVDQAVVNRLAKTTAEVLFKNFEDSKSVEKIEGANSVYKQAVQEEENIARIAGQLNEVQKKYQGQIDVYEASRASFESDVYYANYYAGLAADALAQARDPKGGRTTENALEWLDFYNSEVEKHNYWASWNRQSMQDAENTLRSSGYFREKEPLEAEYREASNRLNAFVTDVNRNVDDLMQSSSNIFSSFESQIKSAFPSEFGEQIAGDANRDALRATLLVPFVGETLIKPDEKQILRPNPDLPKDQQFDPFEVNYRYVSGFKSDGTPYEYLIDYAPGRGILYHDLNNAEDIVRDRQAQADLLAETESEEATGKDASATLPALGAGSPAQVDQPGTKVRENAAAAIGSAPPIDYSLAATDMQGTSSGGAKPFPTIGLNLLTAGTGIEGGKNRAFFNTGGGFGSGGTTTETTYSLVARASETGTNDIVDVGGKLYSLILLPNKQVLVPTKPDSIPKFVEILDDPITKTPLLREVEMSKAPPETVLDIAKRVGETAGGATAGASGASGGREGVQGDSIPSAGTQVLDPSTTSSSGTVRPGSIFIEMPKTDQILSNITGTPTDLYHVPQSSGAATTPTASGASTSTGANLPVTGTPTPEILTAQPSTPSSLPTTVEVQESTPSGLPGGIGIPGGGGFGTGASPGGGEGGVVPGGGQGTGVPGGVGTGTARGDEGTGTGTSTEGSGIGQGGEGTGTGTSEGSGTGEGGGVVEPTTSRTTSFTLPSMLGLGAIGAAASGDYKPTTPGETWLGGLFRQSPDATAGFRRLLGLESEAQEANVYSALRQASGVPDNLARPSSFYSYGKETSPADTFKFYRRGGTVQDDPSGDKMPMSPLLMSHGDIPHKGSHYVNGAGGGQDDLIPAQLADGEYVLDAEIVAALGDGSSKEGAKRLDKFREAIRKHKRSGSLKEIPPKAKSPLAYLRSVK